MANEIELIVEQTRQSFETMVVDANMAFNRESEFALQAIFKSDYNTKLARQNPQSIRDAMHKVAAMGVTLNPAMNLAYLAPRENKLQLIVSYMGLVHVAVESGVVRFARAELVYANDTFRLNGVDKEPTHEFSPFSAPGSRGDLVGTYCVAKTMHGDYLTDWMVIEDVWKIRERSESWKAHEAKGKKSPWADDQSEMVKKTVIKRAYKMWPKAESGNPERLASVIHHMNNTGEGIVLSDEEEKKPRPPTLNFRAGIREIDGCQTIEELAISRKKWQSMASAAEDKYAYDEITAASRKRRDILNSVAQDVEVKS